VASSGGIVRTYAVKPIIYVAAALALVSIVSSEAKAENFGHQAAQKGGWSIDYVVTDMLPTFFDQFGGGGTATPPGP
jgi:hypothetical protein